ncbi:hypothetical protein CSB20_03215 [bacterium DOLZORAL124_64_63]|nr:MAG: hypothetical protein CSB20_03215 [bacterium DOLZORAL124_64_63]
MKGCGGVCFVFDDFHPVFSGHSIYMQQIMRHLQARGRRMSVICWHDGRYPEREEYQGITIRRIKGSYYQPGGVRSLLRALWQERAGFDCLHINGFPDPYGLMISLCRLLGKRLVLQSTLYGSDDGHAYQRHHRGGAIRVRQLALVHAITCISRPLIRTFEDIGFPGHKLVYIPQGVALDRFVPVTAERKAQLRRRLDIPPEAPVALFVGTILRRKGVDWLLKAWIEVQQALPGAHLVLVGMHEFDRTHGSREELNAFSAEMRGIVQEHDLRVRFAGLQEDIAPWYQAADLFILPSRKEGFGNVIIEAMACGLPLVVTPMDGVALETVEEGRNGFIVDDVAGLADRMTALLADPSAAAAMGAAGLEMARRKFDMEVIAEQYDRLYFGDGAPLS